MRNLPAGTWHATSTASWHARTTSDITSADAPGGFELQDSFEVCGKWVWNKVTVGSGQTAHVELYY